MEVVSQQQSDKASNPDTVLDPRPAGVTARLRAALRLAGPAILAYTSVRLIGLVTLFFWAHAEGNSFLQPLSKSDGMWYLRIAEHGYDSAQRTQSDMAFFPLYPGLIAFAEPLSPVGIRATAVAIAGVAAFAAACGLFMIGNHLYGRRAGILLAALWGIVPHAVVQSMAYSEALFTALAAWALYAVLTRRWLTAGVLGLLAGLTRPTASALIPVIMLAALIAILKRRDGWRPWLALVLAPLGWLGYLAWVAQRTGRIDGWFHIQSAGWGTSFDGGHYTFHTALTYLTAPSAFEFYLVSLVLVIAVALYVMSFLDRQPWQLLLFSGLLLATTLGASGYYHSKARFLLPGFALLLPVANALGKTSRHKMWVVVGTLTLMSAYFGGYLLLVWRYSP